jgi:hypothetical protein
VVETRRVDSWEASAVLVPVVSVSARAADSVELTAVTTET